MPITGLQLITVTGKYLKLDGAPATGTVTFSSGVVLVNTAANEIIYPTPFVAVLDINGVFSMSVPATDDPDIAPQGWTYTVSEALNVGNRTYSVELPFNLAGSTIDLADIPHAVAVTDVTAYVTLTTAQLITGQKTFSEDVEVVIGKGYILKSPNGTRYRITVSDLGALTAEPA